MKRKIDWLKVIPVVSGILALAVDFIIQPKLDAKEQDETAAENKKMIQEEVQRQLSLTK